MSEAKGKPGVPGVSLDEALALFLSLTYPNGFPEGVDREELLRVLRAKIAADRPEWAAAGTPPQPPAAETSSAVNYSHVKAEIAQQAQQPEVPTDPGERYFYDRHEEARRNREQREAQEREVQIKETLRQRLIAENRDSDDVAIERALRIRQSLETRLRQAIQLQADASESLTPSPGQTARFVMEQAAPAISSSEPAESSTGLALPPPQVAPTTAAITSPDSRQEFLEKLKHQEPEEQIESLRQFYQARRAQLKPRAEVLNPRRPARSKRDEMLVMAESETPEPTALAFDSRPTSRRAASLEISPAARPDPRGLRLKEGKSK